MKTRKRLLKWVVALALLLFALPLMAQNRYGGYYDDDQWLDDLVAPVALYPDDVLAILLPASTYPEDLRDAAGFLRDSDNDPSARPDDYWDESVRYLLNYPDVVYRLNDDPQWTADLGSAFASDPRAVMEAIQRMRWRAYDAGFLRSDRRQRVIVDDGRIRIVSASPEYVYIPDYDSSIFYSRPAGWSYGYYDTAYPLYYYPYASDYRFGHRFYGGQSAWGIDWWGWDIAAGIIIDWAFWNRSHHGDFYGWQHDWSHHRHDSNRWSYLRSAGTSISTRPISAQVQPLQHPIARPVNLPPPPPRPIEDRPGRPGRPIVTPMPRPAPGTMDRPERPIRPMRPTPEPTVIRPDRPEHPNRDLHPDRSDLGAGPTPQPRPVVERPVRPQPDMQQPVPDRAVRPAPVVRPVQPVVRPVPNQVEKPARPERERKPRDEKDNKDNGDQKDGGQ
jgi:hypothetical protein